MGNNVVIKLQGRHDLMFYEVPNPCVMLLGDSQDSSLYPRSILSRALCSSGTTLVFTSSEETLSHVRMHMYTINSNNIIIT